jgi:hypothetical protein
MTAQTEALPPVPPSPVSADPGLAGLAMPARTIGLPAVLSWAAGMATQAGWHVSLPFVPVYLLTLAAYLLAGHFTQGVAYVWHREKIAAAPKLAAQAKAAEVIAEAMAKDYVVHKSGVVG